MKEYVCLGRLSREQPFFGTDALIQLNHVENDRYERVLTDRNREINPTLSYGRSGSKVRCRFYALQEFLHAFKPCYGGSKPQRKECIQEIANRKRRTLQRPALTTNCGTHCRRRHVVQSRYEIIWMQRLNAMTGQRCRWKICKIVRHDRGRLATDGNSQNMSIIGIGQI